MSAILIRKDRGAKVSCKRVKMVKNKSSTAADRRSQINSKDGSKQQQQQQQRLGVVAKAELDDELADEHCAGDCDDSAYEMKVVMQADDLSDVPRSRRDKCKKCCISVTAFLFSTVGLMCVMVGYTILGGIIFKKLEAPNEILLKNDVKASRADHVFRLWNLTKRLNIFKKNQWLYEADLIIEEYTRKVYTATKKQGWDGKTGQNDMQWTFAGSLLYSITVITTIGYGHIAPKTEGGRIATIFYAMVGIPLTLLALTNLGGFMATAFRYLYRNVCTGLCCVCCCLSKIPESAGVVRRQQSSDAETTSALTRANSDCGSDPSDPESPNFVAKFTPSDRKDHTTCRDYWGSCLKHLSNTQNINEVSVPIYISVLVLSVYIMAGALMFSLWEDDWSYLIGSYFCFVTLTTIGFGDFVPGTSVNPYGSQEKLVLCCLYLVFGLALIAMCFDLMQEDARRKLKYIGQRMGLVKNNDSSNGDNPSK